MFPSPDGRWFAYVENNFTLKRIPASGGAPVTVLVMDGPSRGAAWGPDDTIVFATAARETGLQRVSSGGEPVTVLTRPDRERGEADHVNPVWLPGGRHLLFTILPVQGGLDAAKVAVLDVATGVARPIIEGGYAARYIDTGHLVYAAAGARAPRLAANLSRVERATNPLNAVAPAVRMVADPVARTTMGLSDRAIRSGLNPSSTLRKDIGSVRRPATDRQVGDVVRRTGATTGAVNDIETPRVKKLESRRDRSSRRSMGRWNGKSGDAVGRPR